MPRATLFFRIPALRGVMLAASVLGGTLIVAGWDDVLVYAPNGADVDIGPPAIRITPEKPI